MGNGSQSKQKQYYWLIYLAALLAGLLLIADAVNYYPATKTTARLGIALLYTAFAFIVGGTRASATIGTILVWAAVLVAMLL
jgi:uncharacterized membrane protein